MAAKGTGLEVSWSSGVAVQSVDTSGIPEAVAATKAADLALVVVGDSAEAVGYDGSASTGEGADRTSIALAGVRRGPCRPLQVSRPIGC